MPDNIMHLSARAATNSAAPRNRSREHGVPASDCSRPLVEVTVDGVSVRLNDVYIDCYSVIILHKGNRLFLQEFSECRRGGDASPRKAPYGGALRDILAQSLGSADSLRWLFSTQQVLAGTALESTQPFAGCCGGRVRLVFQVAVVAPRSSRVPTSDY
jgi:hypothetical protein